MKNKILTLRTYASISLLHLTIACTGNISNFMEKELPSNTRVYGLPGTELTEEIKITLLELNPSGIILMGRNIETTEQTKSLITELKKLLEGLESKISASIDINVYGYLSEILGPGINFITDDLNMKGVSEVLKAFLEQLKNSKLNIWPLFCHELPYDKKQKILSNNTKKSK